MYMQTAPKWHEDFCDCTYDDNEAGKHQRECLVRWYKTQPWNTKTAVTDPDNPASWALLERINKLTATDRRKRGWKK